VSLEKSPRDSEETSLMMLASAMATIEQFLPRYFPPTDFLLCQAMRLARRLIHRETPSRL
jgi:hypothetical protein